MRGIVLGAFIAAATLPLAPLAARDQDERAAGREPDAEDVAMTPFNDLNLKKDQIHPVLLTAAADPYALPGIVNCKTIEIDIAALDTALGPDVDVSRPQSDRLSTGRVAKSLVASLIPFRGVLRELSGANEHERNQAAAIYAGSIRRGFLKGIGQQQGCAYPARPAFTRVTVENPVTPSAGPAKTRTVEASPAATTFVSEPVVQPASAAPKGARRR